MKKIFFQFTLLFMAIDLSAQTEKFDVASFIPPAGWHRIDSVGMLVFYDTKTNNNLTTFCQIVLYPSRPSTGTPSTDFSNAWNEFVVGSTKIPSKPIPLAEESTDGWNILTGYTDVPFQGGKFTCMLVTASGFEKAFSVMINVTGENYGKPIQDFFNHLKLDGKGSVSSLPGNSIQSAGFGVYSFIAPESWKEEKSSGSLKFFQVHNNGLACILTILPPQNSSGNVETEVRQVFSQMYPGWRFYYSDARRDEVRKGKTKQGLDYCMMEAPMVRDRPSGGWDYETGVALVIGKDKQQSIVTLRHEATGASCQCYQKYEYWGRFFNSFAFKNFSPLSPNMEEISKRLIGSWMSSGNRAIGEYIFAGNGRFQFIGGYGSLTQVDWRTLELKTSGFQGDGRYTVKEDQIIMKRDGDATDTRYRFRLEKINKGSTGWKDRIIFLNETPADGGRPFEVVYEKTVK